MRPSRMIAIAVLLVALIAIPLYATKKSDTGGVGAAEEAPASGLTETIAIVSGEPITRGDLYSAIASQIEFEQLKRSLENLVLQRILEAEAESRSISVQELAEAETLGKVPAPSDEEIAAYYEQNKARFGERTLEESKDDIDRMIRSPKLAQRRTAFIQELYTKYGVEFKLEPPRVAVRVPSGEPSKGPEDAPIQMVMFSDFQCPYCKRAYEPVQSILETFGDKIHFVYRDYPLPNHDRAAPAAEAARCAGDQGKYWQYFDNLMTVGGDLGDQDLKARAASLELDAAAFSACLDDTRHEAAVQMGFTDGQKLGVTGTPTFFINGMKMVGAKPLPEFTALIESELEKAETKSN